MPSFQSKFNTSQSIFTPPLIEAMREREAKKQQSQAQPKIYNSPVSFTPAGNTGYMQMINPSDKKPIGQAMPKGNTEGLIKAAGNPKVIEQPIFKPAISGKSGLTTTNKTETPIVEEKPAIFTPPTDKGEYSTAREIGTGLANFAEHFGAMNLGANTSQMPERWQALRQQFREKAPNSDISKIYQNTYKKFGIDTDGKSAWDLKQMHPDIRNLLDKDQFDKNQQMQMESLNARMRMAAMGGGGGKPKSEFIPNDKRFINASDNKIDAAQQKEIISHNASYNDFTNKMNRVEQINKELGNSNASLTPFKSDREKALIAERDAALKDAKYAYGTLKFGALRDSDMPRLDEMFPALGTWTPQTEGTIQGKLQALRKNAANEYKSKMKAYGLEQVAPLQEDIEDEIAKRQRGK